MANAIIQSGISRFVSYRFCVSGLCVPFRAVLQTFGKVGTGKKRGRYPQNEKRLPGRHHDGPGNP